MGNRLVNAAERARGDTLKPRRLEAGGVVTLLTDFGGVDPYVGIMKGVLLSIAGPHTAVDLTHGIPPQDIVAGAYQLSVAWRWFPAGTVHVAVVDPGVGGSRAPLVVSAAGHLFVGPDNGVLESALAEPGAQAWVITDARRMMPELSRTFHGRDVFAPAAAWLLRGIDPATMGPPAPTPVRLPASPVEAPGGRLLGRVLVVDTFGNLITDLPGPEAEARMARGEALHVGGVRLERLSRTYTDVEPGVLLALVGSSGRVEFSVRGGSARQVLGVGPGEGVWLG